MWTYEQKTGRLLHDGVLIGIGWAGHDAGKNNPDMQNDPDIGPLPVGFYTVGPEYHHPELGPCTMDLIPDASNEMFGRADFRCHGSAFIHPEESSKGCIIQILAVRMKLSGSNDRWLEVVRGEA